MAHKPAVSRGTTSRRGATRPRAAPRTRRNLLRAITTAQETMASRHEATLAAAARVFDEELTLKEQLVVAEDVVLTRSAELSLAFPNVVGTSFGFRRQRDAGRRGHRIVSTPCVRFLVKEKWPSVRRPGRQKGAIPRRLLAMASVGGRRLLCAVPTDVEDVVLYSSIVAHGCEVSVTWNDAAPEHGMIACTLTRDTFPGDLWALGCRHVFSLSDEFFTTNVLGASVSAGTEIVATTRAVAGPLGSTISFDAQLAQVTNRGALRTHFTGVALQDVAADVHELAGLPTYFILTPRGAIGARFVDVIPSRPLYRLAGVDITHEWLVQSAPDAPVVPGDSGSPVVSQRDGGILLGMHVAGSPSDEPVRKAFMIPAWQLFDTSHYSGANGEVWTLEDP